MHDSTFSITAIVFNNSNNNYTIIFIRVNNKDCGGWSCHGKGLKNLGSGDEEV